MFWKNKLHEKIKVKEFYFNFTITYATGESKYSLTFDNEADADHAKENYLTTIKSAMQKKKIINLGEDLIVRGPAIIEFWISPVKKIYL